MVLGLDHETWLDVTVNLVPIAILAIFEVLFVILNPWGWDLFTVVVWHFLTLFPLVLLAILSWVAGIAIQGAEGEMLE